MAVALTLLTWTQNVCVRMSAIPSILRRGCTGHIDNSSHEGCSDFGLLTRGVLNQFRSLQPLTQQESLNGVLIMVQGSSMPSFRKSKFLHGDESRLHSC